MKKLNSCWRVLLGLLLTITAVATPQNLDQEQQQQINKIFLFWAAAPHPSSAWATHPSIIEVRWYINKGYHLNLDNLKFKALNDSIKLGTPVLQASDQQTRLLALVFQIPIISALVPQFKLQISFQGCSDQGFCYPVATRTFTIRLAPITLEPSIEYSSTLQRFSNAWHNARVVNAGRAIILHWQLLLSDI